MKEISNYVIRISGKAQLPKEIDIGQNYHVALSGSITSQTDTDNEDNTLTRLYTFKPIKVEILNPMGETIVAKDTRSNSQLLRSLIYKKWLNAGATIDQETYYNKVCDAMMVNIDKIISWAQID